jgi:nucleotide-binding universal stress UspA family protein
VCRRLSLENAPGSERVTRERTELAERTCAELSADGGRATQVVRTDVPHRAVLEYATDRGIDLVVVGTHGRTGDERSLPGSVAERTVRTSPVPVVTIGRRDAER